MELKFKIPFYARVALIFISVFAFVYTMYIGQDIIIPIVYATIFAILLNPFVNFLLRKKMSKIIAITLVVSISPELKILRLPVFNFEIYKIHINNY